MPPLPAAGAKPRQLPQNILKQSGQPTPTLVESPSEVVTSPPDQSRKPKWNQSSYFAPRESNHPDSPSAAASGAKTPSELLRRLSLVDNDRPSTPEVRPQIAYPTLGLSGRLISATFCIPHALEFVSGRDWIIRQRRGTSTLFDAFAHLSDERNPWDHILVGWTGEIQPPDLARPRSSASHDPARTASLNKLAAQRIDKASAPIPLDSSNRTTHPAPTNNEPLRVTKSDRERLTKQLENADGSRTVPVWLSDPLRNETDDLVLKDQSRWRRYAEHQLYTLFHYKQNEPTDGRAEKKWWNDYQRMNVLFAERIIEVYQPGDVIWIHDYHLFLLPSLLRQRLPGAYIGFYLHIPFPSSEFLKCLPQRKEVLTGILGANITGFQTYSYSRHFSSCCTRILGFEASPAGVDAYGAHVAVDAFPIGIDASSIARIAHHDRRIDAKIARIREQYAGQKIIVGRDRLDSCRGVAQKLEGFEMFLERYPEWHEKVVLIQVTSPTSREEEKEDAGHKIANKISDLVAKINGTYGGLEWTPVFHFPQYLSREEYFALLRVADVGLITSVRDGMNTTSLEYVVCQKDTHGPVILSEFSGTAGSLTSAIHINPWDLGGVAAAINEALTMKPEAKAKMYYQMYQHVTINNVQLWSKTFLTRLLNNLISFDQSMATPPLDRTALLERYKKTKKRLFMFDYDGTLTPIVKDPQAAIPSDRIIRTVKSLAADPRNAVWIISGRDKDFLDEWMGHISELGLSAEHGSFMRPPMSNDWENLTEKADMSWQAEVLEVFQHYTERTPGSWIERKSVALTWHIRRSDPDFGAFMAREAKKHLERTVAKKFEVEVMNGKANLEVRPSFVNKGEIAKRLVEQRKPDLVFCAGDDFTDEDMFRSLRASDLAPESVFSVTVGASSKQTLASYHVLESTDIIASIAALNESNRTADGGSTLLVNLKHPMAVNVKR